MPQVQNHQSELILLFIINKNNNPNINNHCYTLSAVKWIVIFQSVIIYKTTIRLCKLYCTSKTILRCHAVLMMAEVRCLRSGTTSSCACKGQSRQIHDRCGTPWSLIQSDLKHVLLNRNRIYIRGKVNHVVLVIVPIECSKPLEYIADKAVGNVLDLNQ